MAITGPSNFQCNKTQAAPGDTLHFTWSKAYGDFEWYAIFSDMPYNKSTSDYFSANATSGDVTIPSSGENVPNVGETIYYTLGAGKGPHDSIEDYNQASGRIAIKIIAPTPQTAPTNFTVTPTTAKAGQTLTFNWSAATGDFTQYAIVGIRSDSGTTNTIFVDKSKLTATGTFPSDLPEGGYVRYSVKASVTAPSSESVTVYKASETVTPTAPDAPSSISVGDVVQGNPVSVTWSAVSGASAYTLQRSLNGGTFADIYTGSALSYTDSAGDSWTSVQYRVKAVADGYSSEWTTSQVITVQAQPSTDITLPPNGRIVHFSNWLGQPAFPPTVIEAIFRQSDGKNLGTILSEIETTPGPPGKDGKDGKDGVTGPAGKDGNLMYATFYVNPATGSLFMITDNEYAGPQFRLADGKLEVVLNYGG